MLCRRASVLAFVLVLLVGRGASALITGGTGNKPLKDPGWPRGAEPIFNSTNRVAWWEGPPFGGGQWHSECRGEAREFNAVLFDFSKMDAKISCIVVHDGVGKSVWINPNRDKEKALDARVDWVFMTWQAESWERLRKMPPSLRSDEIAATDSPPAQIDVYTGGNLRWADVLVPKGIEVIDQRLEAHGFTPADGVVIEGTATDLATKALIAGATMRLETVAPRKTGGYDYPKVAEAKADASGRWILKNTPAGWCRVVVSAEGYAPRVVGYGQFDDHPAWAAYNTGLARPGSVTGRVSDDSGRPLDGVDVRVSELVAADGTQYRTPNEDPVKTDAEGRFHAEGLPVGGATVWITKPGFVRPGLGPKIQVPAKDVELTMTRAAGIRITVDFGDRKRPGGYMVQIGPEGGDKIGSWGGAGDIDAKNAISFGPMPPGKYLVWGRPNPGSDGEQTEKIPVDLKGGETIELTLKAR